MALYLCKFTGGRFDGDEKPLKVVPQHGDQVSINSTGWLGASSKDGKQSVYSWDQTKGRFVYVGLVTGKPIT